MKSQAFLLRARSEGVLLITAALFVVLCFASNVFLTRVNLLNIVDQSAAIGIIACGGTIVIIGGAFDLSTGALYALSGVVAAEVANHTGSGVAGLAVGVAAGAVVGLGNGLLVAIGRINAFIATLGSGIIIGGAATVLSGGFPITVTSSSFSALGTGTVAGVRVTIVEFGVFAIVAALVLARTTFGRRVYATGGNRVAARLAGIRVDGITILTFGISGLACGLGGALDASRVSIAQSTVGSAIPLQAIAMIVIGGTSIFGGQGAIWRTLVGVFLLALIGNGFDLLAINPSYTQITQGVIILIAVFVDAWSRDWHELRSGIRRRWSRRARAMKPGDSSSIVESGE